MTFDEWWKQMKPAECDEVKEYFEECWSVARAEQRKIDAEIAKNVGSGTDKYGEYYLMSSYECTEAILKEGS
jgi:hypothetical protein